VSNRAASACIIAAVLLFPLLNSCSSPVEAQWPGMQGPAGPIGPQGLQGPAGPAGLVGPQGPAGNSALPGAQGPQGSVGPQGIPGARGSNGRDGVLGVLVVMGQVVVAPNSGYTTIATCPGGRIAISGGYGRVNPGVIVRESRPGQLSGQIPGEFDRHIWTVGYRNDTSASQTVYTYAVCAFPS